MATSPDSSVSLSVSPGATSSQPSVALTMSSFSRHIRRQENSADTPIQQLPAYADTVIFTATHDSDVYYMSEELSLSDMLAKPVVTNASTINLFGSHSLKPQHVGPVIRTEYSPGWLFPIVIVLIGAFAWLRVFYNRYLGQMLYALVNVNLANQIVRDENILLQRATVYLNVLFYLIGALFLYEISFRFNWPLSALGTGFNRFLFFVLLISAVYAGKFLLLKSCGWLFDMDRELSTYLFTIFIINNLLGTLNEQGIGIDACPVAPEKLRALLVLMENGTHAANQAREVFAVLYESPEKDPAAIADSLGFKAAYAGELKALVDQAIANNPSEVEAVKAGNEKLLNFLTGQVMKAASSKPNPKQVTELLRARLM